MELIQDSFIRTPFTKKIVNAPWYSERGGVITFLQHTTIIREKDVEAKIKTKLCEEEKLCEPSQLSKIQVDVRMLEGAMEIYVLQSGKLGRYDMYGAQPDSPRVDGAIDLRR